MQAQFRELKLQSITQAANKGRNEYNDFDKVRTPK